MTKTTATQSGSVISNPAQSNSTRAKMKVLGYAGLLPFFLLAIAVYAPSAELAANALASLQHYAAVILTFIGAVHWGRALAAPENTPAEHKRLYWAVTPSLISWVALSLPVDAAIALLVFAFVLCWWVDRRFYAEMPISGWYLEMRSYLTLCVVGGLIVGWCGV